MTGEFLLSLNFSMSNFLFLFLKIFVIFVSSSFFFYQLNATMLTMLPYFLFCLHLEVVIQLRIAVKETPATQMLPA